ncbi:MAG TPA: nucleoside recognition domain-containing protein [Desulfobacteria bacterium]|nr:nucleoside recognition domain-containing protein [Desulfobacteria bacterium]
MVNTVWLFLLVTGIVVSAANGKIESVTTAAMSAAQLGVEVAIGLIGVMSLWLGIMRLAEEAGMVRGLARLVEPLTHRLFPSIPRNHPALGAIILNISANILGLGNAATPFGLKAMEEMQKLNPDKETASNAMCTFLALNTSAITLIPATIIAVRLKAGSANPTEIIGTTIFATGVAMTCAVTVDFIIRRRRGDGG